MPRMYRCRGCIDADDVIDADDAVVAMPEVLVEAQDAMLDERFWGLLL